MGRMGAAEQRHEAKAAVAGRVADAAASASRIAAGTAVGRAQKAAQLRGVQVSEAARAAKARGRRRQSKRQAKAQAVGALLGERALEQTRHARETGMELSQRLREQALETQAKAQEATAELGQRARKQAHETQATAAEFAERTLAQIRSARAAGATRGSTRKLEKRAARLATDLRNVRVEEMTGSRRRRGLKALLLAFVGVVAGYAAVKARSSRPDPFRDDLADAADRAAARAQETPTASVVDAPPPVSDVPSGGASADVSAGAAPVSALDATPEQAVSEPPLAGASLAERVRAALDSDPRTRTLAGLAINVADGTVFVRGDVPDGTDEGVIREVIASVPGVSDIDLQVRTE